MVTKESRTVTPTEECDRSEYYITENVTGRRVARKNDQVRRLGTDRVGPVVTEDAPRPVKYVCSNASKPVGSTGVGGGGRFSFYCF